MEYDTYPALTLKADGKTVALDWDDSPVAGATYTVYRAEVSGGPYANNANDKRWRTFDTTGANKVALHFLVCCPHFFDALAVTVEVGAGQVVMELRHSGFGGGDLKRKKGNENKRRTSSRDLTRSA